MTLPRDWFIAALKNVSIKIQDGNYGASYPKQDEFVPNGIPFLTSKAIGSSNRINFSKVDYISFAKHCELNKAHIEPNDVLFTNRGARVGTVAMVPNTMAIGNIGPQLTLIRANPLKLHSYYLFCFLQSSLFLKQIHQMDSGSAMNFFGITDTGKFQISLPPLPEQRKIAEILSTWDEAIDLTAQLIAAKQRRKQGLMQQLLTGKVRFPGFEGEWEKTTLEEICVKFLNGGTPSTSNKSFWGGSIPWITGADIVNQRISSVRSYVTPYFCTN